MRGIALLALLQGIVSAAIPMTMGATPPEAWLYFCAAVPAFILGFTACYYGHPHISRYEWLRRADRKFMSDRRDIRGELSGIFVTDEAGNVYFATEKELDRWVDFNMAGPEKGVDQ